MITGEIKNKIDSLWDIFAAGGLTNPLEVIEQITYLMFIKELDTSDNKREKESSMLGLTFKSIFSEKIYIGERSIEGKQLKWSIFRDYPANKQYEIMQEWVFPFIKDLHDDKDSAYSKYMSDAIFKLPTPLVLSKVIDSLDEIYELMDKEEKNISSKEKNVDIRGDVYEYLLSKIATAGRNGQFRTPRHIIRMMVDLMKPTPDELICDPACGTSGFLVTASDYLRENYKNDILMNRQKRDHYMNHMFHGFDMDRTMLRIGAMNMMTHGVESPNIEYRDSLSDQNSDNEKYDTGKYIGDSYRDLTRIANINEDLWSELFFRNSENLLNSIVTFEAQLALIKKALLENDEQLLKKLFIESSYRREKLEK